MCHTPRAWRDQHSDWIHRHRNRACDRRLPRRVRHDRRKHQDHDADPGNRWGDDLLGHGSQCNSSPSAMPVHTRCTRPTLRIHSDRGRACACTSRARATHRADERDAIARLPITPGRLARDQRQVIKHGADRPQHRAEQRQNTETTRSVAQEIVGNRARPAARTCRLGGRGAARWRTDQPWRRHTASLPSSIDNPQSSESGFVARGAARRLSHGAGSIRNRRCDPSTRPTPREPPRPSPRLRSS